MRSREPSRSREARGPARTPIADPAHRRPRLLLVEDHKDLGQLLKKVLEGAGYDVRLAERFAAGVQAGREEPWDVVIGDWSLPDGDGLDLLREVRRFQPDVRGIALTGYGDDADVQASLAAGYCEHVCKTGDVADLFAAVERTLRHSA